MLMYGFMVLIPAALQTSFKYLFMASVVSRPFCSGMYRSMTISLYDVPSFLNLLLIISSALCPLFATSHATEYCSNKLVIAYAQNRLSSTTRIPVPANACRDGDDGLWICFSASTCETCYTLSLFSRLSTFSSSLKLLPAVAGTACAYKISSSFPMVYLFLRCCSLHRLPKSSSPS